MNSIELKNTRLSNRLLDIMLGLVWRLDHFGRDTPYSSWARRHTQKSWKQRPQNTITVSLHNFITSSSDLAVPQALNCIQVAYW